MQQNGKRATLRCDKLFTDEGVYTYDTSNNSVEKLSPNRFWAPLCAALKMDEVMSGNDTQRLQGERKKERMGERPPLDAFSASGQVMLNGSDAAGSSSDASDDSTTLSARGTREAHSSSSNIVHQASSAIPYSHDGQEEFISGRISEGTIFQGLVPTARVPQPPRRHPVILEKPRWAPTASPPPTTTTTTTTDEPQPPSSFPLQSQ